MEKIKINLSFQEDIAEKIWIERRSIAYKFLMEQYNSEQDLEVKDAIGYLFELIKLDGDKKYLL